MKSAATLILFLLYNFASAQPDTSYNCLARWKKGEEKIILITHSVENNREGNTEPPFEISYEAHIQVTDSTEEGYTLKWVFHLPQEVKKANPLMVLAMPVYEGMQMIFKTDRNGVFKELINWKEVKDTYLKMMMVSLPRNLDDSTKKAIEKSNEMFNSREMAESSFINEIQLYHAPFGTFFTLNGNTFPASFPSPFTSEPIPALVSEKLLSLSKTADHVSFNIGQDIDLDNATSFIKGMLKKMDIPDDSLTVMTNGLLSTIRMKDHRVYQFSPSTGWLKKLVFQKTAVTDQFNKKESFVFEMK
ncbi:MAG TPA: hypothetical protein PKM75_11925 [Prolixibacteraceae bacterium]|nr:hypothetical protein [Prolixibacteraceae bacterium]